METNQRRPGPVGHSLHMDQPVLTTAAQEKATIDLVHTLRSEVVKRARPHQAAHIRRQRRERTDRWARPIGQGVANRVIAPESLRAAPAAASTPDWPYLQRLVERERVRNPGHRGDSCLPVLMAGGRATQPGYLPRRTSVRLVVGGYQEDKQFSARQARGSRRRGARACTTPLITGLAKDVPVQQFGLFPACSSQETSEAEAQ
jgi:hypothetical protein